MAVDRLRHVLHFLWLLGYFAPVQNGSTGQGQSQTVMAPAAIVGAYFAPELIPLGGQAIRAAGTTLLGNPPPA